DDEGVRFLVPVHDKRVAVDHRRNSLAPAETRNHLAQVTLPLEMAVEVVAVEAARAERDVEIFAVCGGRGGGITVRRMVPFMRHLLRGDLLPADLARLPVDAQDDELMIRPRRLRFPLESWINLGQFAVGNGPFGVDRREN